MMDDDMPLSNYFKKRKIDTRQDQKNEIKNLFGCNKLFDDDVDDDSNKKRNDNSNSEKRAKVD